MYHLLKLPKGLWSYVLWQLPSWIILTLLLILSHALFNLPTWIAVVVLTLFLAKDFAMFPIMQDVFRPSNSAWSGLIGARGRTIEPLAPIGYVKVAGEIWKAQKRHPDRDIPAGSEILVVDVRGLTLIVDRQVEERSGAANGSSR